MEWEEEEDKKRDLKQNRSKEKARIKVEGKGTETHPAMKHIMEVKSRRRKIRKSRPDIVRNWIIRANKMKRRKRPRSTK